MCQVAQAEAPAPDDNTSSAFDHASTMIMNVVLEDEKALIERLLQKPTQ